MKSQARLLRAGADALERTAQDRAQIANSLAQTETRRRLNQVVRPNSISSNLRKAGIVLVLSPDPLGPIVDVPGVAMLGASYVMQRRQPWSAKSLLNETRVLLEELQPLL